jgi:hypothetical protein
MEQIGKTDTLQKLCTNAVGDAVHDDRPVIGGIHVNAKRSFPVRQGDDIGDRFRDLGGIRVGRFECRVPRDRASRRRRDGRRARAFWPSSHRSRSMRR